MGEDTIRPSALKVVRNSLLMDTSRSMILASVLLFITISFKTDTKGSKIAISDFNSKLEVSSLRYSFVAYVDGLNRWEGSSIIVKPLFENLDSVNEVIGDNTRIANGFLLI